MHGSDRSSDRGDYEASLGWHGKILVESEMAPFSASECRSVLGKRLTPPTLSERLFFVN